MRVTAIVPAAGAGFRFGKKRGPRKPFFIINRHPILAHTLRALEGSRLIDDIIIAVHADDIERCKKVVKRSGIKNVRHVVAGGRTRFASVKRCLSRLPGGTEIVFIHDGVRPFISSAIIADAIAACKRFDAAVVGVPVVPTVKFVDRELVVRGTPERKSLYAVQTPQVFKKQIILRAYAEARGERSAITDDSMLAERLGQRVKIVPGSYDNIKITTPQDLVLAGILLGDRGRMRQIRMSKSEIRNKSEIRIT